MISSFFGLVFNQKITIGAVKPQLGKRALARPIVAGGSGGARALSHPSPQRVLRGPSPLDKNLRSETASRSSSSDLRN